MKPINSENLIKAISTGYDKIPVLQDNKAAKILVADAIKSNNLNPADVLSFIYSAVAEKPGTLTDKDWKVLTDKAIKMEGGHTGSLLTAGTKGKKGSFSYEDVFRTVVSGCGMNPDYLKTELLLGQLGWKNVIETLIKSRKAEVAAPAEKKVEEPVAEKAPVKKTVKTAARKEEKPAIKSGVDPRCIAIVGIKDGERREWSSYRACEIDIFNDAKLGHGYVSQYFSGKLKSVKGWTLYKKGEEPQEETAKVVLKRTKTRAVIMFHLDKKGRQIDKKTFPSITAAFKATGIKHSSICKCCNGTKGYATAGGYHWNYADKDEKATA